MFYARFSFEASRSWIARAGEFIAGRAIDQKPYKEIKRPQKKDGAAAHAIQLASRL